MFDKQGAMEINRDRALFKLVTEVMRVHLEGKKGRGGGGKTRFGNR